MSRDQNAGRSYSMKIYNSSTERVEEFKYLGTTLTNKNSIQEGINRLTPNDHFSGRTATLTSRCCIFYLFNKYTC